MSPLEMIDIRDRSSLIVDQSRNSDMATPTSDDEFDESSAESSTPSEQLVELDRSLKFLYVLNGATMQLPSLALLAIVNDRVAIPPAYLPAYGAIAFLPYSLKPCYAFLSSPKSVTTSDYISLGQQGKHKRQHVMLAALLAANAVSYMGTALLIPVGGIFACFVWAFLRGLTSSWSRFLVDQSLIYLAQQKEKQLSSSSLTYQAISSLFQSQALTYGNLGSLLASFGSFGLFAWRQHHLQQEGHEKQEPLSETFVVALLLLTAGVSFAGSIIVIFHFMGRNEDPSPFVAKEEEDAVTSVIKELAMTSDVQESSTTPRPIWEGQSRPSLWRPSYDALSTSDEDQPDTDTIAALLQVQEANIPVAPSSVDGDSFPIQTTRPNPSQGQGGRQWTLRDRGDVATLVLLQAILIGAALKQPIVSVFNSQVAWTAPMVILGICLMGSLVLSTSGHDTRKEQRDSARIPESQCSTLVPPRRLGIYLILRHSVPIASILMYYYVYTVFQREPLFLQFLMIVESSVSVTANWFYSRFLSLRFHSGWGIVGLTAVLSILGSLMSLLDVIFVHHANGHAQCSSVENGDANDGCDFHVDSSLRWLILGVGTVTYFMGQIGFMPSLVLATANVVPCSNDPFDNQDEESNPNLQARAPLSDAAQVGDGHPLYDEGVQYATFVSCIDFGAQLGDWISIPIIQAFGVSRENNWANLDRYIVLCALIRIASVSFLWLIRPPPAKQDISLD